MDAPFKLTSALTITRAKDGGYFVTDPATPSQMVSTVLMAGPLAVCLAYVEELFTPPVKFAGVELSAADLAELRMLTPGSLRKTEPPPAEPMTLSDVLETYRRSGAQAGAQVVDKNTVVAWIGDIQAALLGGMKEFRAWGPLPSQILFQKATGPAAEALAAKWLLDQWDPTHG